MISVCSPVLTVGNPLSAFPGLHWAAARIAVGNTYLEFCCELLLQVTRSRGSATPGMFLKYSETHRTFGGCLRGAPPAATRKTSLSDGFKYHQGGQMPLCTTVSPSLRCPPASRRSTPTRCGGSSPAPERGLIHWEFWLFNFMRTARGEKRCDA